MGLNSEKCFPVLFQIDTVPSKVNETKQYTLPLGFVISSHYITALTLVQRKSLLCSIIYGYLKNLSNISRRNKKKTYRGWNGKKVRRITAAKRILIR